jgi:hypothetical protein
MSLTIDQIQTELGAYFRSNNKAVTAMFYKSAADSEILKRARVITAIQGKFPAFHSVTDRVIQNFRAQWDAFGDTKMKVNELNARQIKVNFALKPATILNSWLAETYDEGASMEEKSISQYIMNQELMPRIAEDLVWLAVNGVYASTGGFGVFGKAFNGVEESLRLALLDADNSAYKIPLATITDANIVDEVTKFERNIPSKVAGKIQDIFMSRNNAYRYALRMQELFGNNVLLQPGDYMKTRLNKYNIVPINESSNDNLIWTTVPGNMVRTINKFDGPKLTDIQKLDYDIKLFFEAWDGIDFWMNQMIFASVTSGSGSGLTTDNSLYYS